MYTVTSSSGEVAVIYQATWKKPETAIGIMLPLLELLLVSRRIFQQSPSANIP